MRLFITILALTFTNSAFGEITDKRVYDNFYKSCMLEKDPAFTYHEMSTYCECTGKAVMKNFTVKELMILEGKIAAAGSDEEEYKIAATNDKFMNLIIDCVSKIIN